MRLKIIAGNLAAVLLVGLAAFVAVRGQLHADLGQEVDERIAQDGQLLARSFRLSGLTFVDFVADRAKTQQVRDTFLGLDENSRRTRAHQAANAVASWFQDPARGRPGAPDIVAITDETGKVIARSQDPNRMHGVQLGQQLPAVRQVLGDGAARHDVWDKTDEGKVLQTGVAAIRNESGAIVGALVVGYDLSNGLAQAEADLLGRDVAFITEGKVYSSSLSGGVAEALKAELFGEQQAGTAAALEGQGSRPWKAILSDDEWIGVTAPLPMSPSVPVAYAVLANRSDRLAIAGAVNTILYLTIFGVLFVLAYGFVIGASFLRPVEQIEEGVLAVINGRTDLRLDVESAEFGGLAYRINQLINVFTGVEEEDEDGRVSAPPPAGAGGWGGGALAEAAPAPSGGSGGGADAGPIDDPAVAAQLEAEDEATYLSRVYEEYVAAKQAAGENVAIREEVFTKRLVGQGAALAKQHGCRMVRFRVERSGNRVDLRPVIIR